MQFNHSLINYVSDKLISDPLTYEVSIGLVLLNRHVYGTFTVASLLLKHLV
jgi:hypothetical protein